MLDLHLDDITEWVRLRKLSSVAVQLPEGLKIRATEIADHLSSKADVSVIILGDPCYGACDLNINYKKVAEGLVHIGHSPMPSLTQDDNILFIERLSHTEIREGMAKIADLLPERIGLLSTVQYVSTFSDAKEVLESFGKKVFIGNGDGRIKYAGQVLGCNCSAATAIADRVDCFLYIGEGEFHPLAAAFGVGKEIMVFDPLTYELRSVNETRDRLLRRRFAMIESAKEAASFLIIVSSKVGQRRDAVADDLIKKITSKGKKAYKVMIEEINPDALLAYRVDAYISTACPRLAMDDSVRYGKPMLTPPEAEAALGMREWDNYVFDSI
ncbi:MAG: diphthamide biosynthesis enzyme Dph2 [Methanomassiliicoccaceae archaeon]|jgi:2-(3-amino-3-carboxypropyl)histidine synthase|nr:diphthamide biosynthesis enzyme Dph2 [Methanomassiliicoccaceae archaeon]